MPADEAEAAGDQDPHAFDRMGVAGHAGATFAVRKGSFVPRKTIDR
jgi:hypothetical protein